MNKQHTAIIGALILVFAVTVSNADALSFQILTENGNLFESLDVTTSGNNTNTQIITLLKSKQDALDTIAALGLGAQTIDVKHELGILTYGTGSVSDSWTGEPINPLTNLGSDEIDFAAVMTYAEQNNAKLVSIPGFNSQAYKVDNNGNLAITTITNYNIVGCGEYYSFELGGTPSSLVNTTSISTSNPHAFTRAGDVYYIAQENTNTVYAYDIHGVALPTKNINLGQSYNGISMVAEGGKLYIKDSVGSLDQYYYNGTKTIQVPPLVVSSIERYRPSAETTSSSTLIYKVVFNNAVTGVDVSDFVLSANSTGGQTSAITYTKNPSLVIPTSSTLQDVTVSDTINISGSGAVTSVTIDVDITHTYRGDLKVDLISPDGTVNVLHNNIGGWAQNLVDTYMPNFNGKSITGNWELRVNDNYPGSDSGILNSWTLNITHDDPNNPVIGITGSDDEYTVIVFATTDGTYNLDLISSGHGIEDESNSALLNIVPTGSDETYIVSNSITDTVPPTLSSIQRYSPLDATTESSTLIYEVIFSEPVTGVSTTDFILSDGTPNPVDSMAGSGDVYYITVPSSTHGTYNLDLISTGHGIEDNANNPLTDISPTRVDETYTVGIVEILSTSIDADIANNIYYMLTESSILAYDLLGQRLAENDIKLLSENNSPTGLAITGNIAYVVDSAESKIYAYWLSNVRVEGQDISLDDMNTLPRALVAAENGNILVLDYSGTIYEYQPKENSYKDTLSCPAHTSAGLTLEGPLYAVFKPIFANSPKEVNIGGIVTTGEFNILETTHDFNSGSNHGSNPIYNVKNNLIDVKNYIVMNNTYFEVKLQNNTETLMVSALDANPPLTPFFKVIGLQPNLPYQILDDHALAVTTGMTEFDGSLDITQTDLNSNPMGNFIFKIYPDSVSDRALNFDTLIIDVENKNTINVPSYENKIYIPHAYVSIPVIGTVEIDDMYFERRGGGANLHISYLNGNYTNERFLVPILPEYSGFKMTINDVDAGVQYKDVLTTASVRIATPGSQTVPYADSTSPILNASATTDTTAQHISTEESLNVQILMSIDGEIEITNNYVTCTEPVEVVQNDDNPLRGYAEIFINGVYRESIELGANEFPNSRNSADEFTLVPNDSRCGGLNGWDIEQYIKYEYPVYPLAYSYTITGLYPGDIVEFVAYAEISGNFIPYSMDIKSKEGIGVAKVQIVSASITIA